MFEFTDQFKWILGYIAVHVVTMLALRKHLQPLIDKQKDPELQKKFAPFMRQDLDLLNIMEFRFPWWLTLWPRWIFHQIWLLFVTLVFFIGTAGQDANTMGPKRFAFWKWWIQMAIRMIVFTTGSYAFVDYRERDDVDFKQYLGPDWKPSFDARRAPTLVGNHTSWIDISINLHLHLPSFVARATTQTIAFVGKYADFLNCIYVSRTNKDSRNDTVDKIGEHQKLYLEGKKKTQVLIFPEGSTTNGEYICQFKKGAFISLLPVQIFTHNNHGSIISLTNQVAVMLSIIQSPFQTLYYDLYPVFEPNEYFWKTHWEPNKDKENKATTYARVIRQIMLLYTGKKDGCEWTAEDRFAWISEYKGLSQKQLVTFVNSQ